MTNVAEMSRIRSRYLRLFLADNHPLLREGLKAFLGHQTGIRVVGEANSGESTLQQIGQIGSRHANGRPHILILGISLPGTPCMTGMSGFETAAKMKQAYPDTQVLVHSRHDDLSYVHAMLEAGASGYVLKRSPPQEIILAVRSIAAGRRFLDPALATVSERDFVPGSLSSRETTILRRSALGYRAKEIAEGLAVSVKTIEADKAQAMNKLGMATRAHLIRYAALQGWFQNLQAPTRVHRIDCAQQQTDAESTATQHKEAT